MKTSNATALKRAMLGSLEQWKEIISKDERLSRGSGAPGLEFTASPYVDVGISTSALSVITVTRGYLVEMANELDESSAAVLAACGAGSLALERPAPALRLRSRLLVRYPP